MENNNSNNFSIEQLFCFSNNRFSAVEKETHDNADNAADNDNDDDNDDNNDQDDNDNDNDDDDADYNLMEKSGRLNRAATTPSPLFYSAHPLKPKTALLSTQPKTSTHYFGLIYVLHSSM